MERKHFEIAIGFVLGIITIFALVAFVQPSASQQAFNKTIEVTGSGTVKVVPNEACVVIAVETEAKTASEATQSNAEKMGSVYAELKKIVDESSIKTRSYSLQPIYEWVEESTTMGKKQRKGIVGYRAVNKIEVICEPDKAGDVVDAAIMGGANRIISITFRISEEQREKAYSEALKKAIGDAKVKADVIASEMGLKSYYPVRVIVGEVYHPMPMPVPYMEERVAKTPVVPSEVKVGAKVRIVYVFD